MARASIRNRALDRIASLHSLAVLPGCSPAAPLERAGIALAPPASWHPERRSTWMVPGTPLAAWSGPDGSSLVIYRTLWVPGGSAEMLAEALGNRLENLPGLKLLVKRVGDRRRRAGRAGRGDRPGNRRRLGPQRARRADRSRRARP